MHHMPVRIQRLNRSRPRRKTSAAKFVAEHIVLPIVMAFAGGVLAALHFSSEPVNVACDTAAHVAAHQTVAMGVQ